MSLEYIEDLRREYLRDSTGVSPEWQRYFAEAGERNGFAGKGNGKSQSASSRRSLFHRAPAADADPRPDDRWSVAAKGQERIDQLIHAFRVRGHGSAKLDPLGSQRPRPLELRLESYGFSETDLDRRFS